MNYALKKVFLTAPFIIFAVASFCETDRKLEPVTFEKVKMEDNFWLPRLKRQKDVLVPFALKNTEPAVENLRRVGKYLKTGQCDTLLNLPRYVASDLFKVMEGVASLLAIERDVRLELLMDSLIDIIADAQCSDGYFYEIHSVPREFVSNHDRGAGKGRYEYVLHSHELYDMGHMYEAAVAYYRATGKRKWLDVSEKSAQHINRVFFEGDPAYNEGKPVMQAPGHEEIEMALFKLSQATGNNLYAQMAKKFLDIRGVTFKDNNYAQQHLPVREQRSAVGHAVRALYLYSGMADMAAVLGDATMRPALDAIWHDIMDTKIHINGGLGSVPGIEGFGPAYMLPNRDTYDETCAAVGNVFFNYRMFLATGDAKYVDAAEVSLFNNVLAGVNLEGNKFFYVNVLEADGKKPFNHGRAGRSPWFGTACCPSNMARLIPQVPGMVYSHTDDDIFCALYAGCKTEIPLASGKVILKQQTEYPFDGKISINITPDRENLSFTLWLRIPTWCGSQFLPGNLYSFADNHTSKVTLLLNGKPIKITPVKGYVPIRREWKAGDKVELDLKVKTRYSVADERVEADRNRVCVTRGPLVFCAEQPDNAMPAINYYIKRIGREGKIIRYTTGIMKDIPILTLQANAMNDEQKKSASLNLIPYYAWNNREDNQSMNVWFARDPKTLLEGLVRTVGNIKSAEATHTFANDEVTAVADGKIPSNSYDTSIPRWTSWPQKGTPQQLMVELRKEQPIEAVSIYWYDDKGGVQVPVSWSLEYRVNGEWTVWPLYTTDRYNNFPDQFNMVHPAKPIKADAIRVCMQPKSDSTVGILEMLVE
ncbi:MAG: glycoside hydrolase family 127 protein [Bacteroidaceae bacterium]|nr:glycoside hydrolase family 127 protein [Bacteroidaceae bacterium]